LYIVNYSKEKNKNLLFSELVDSLNIPYNEDRIHRNVTEKTIYLTDQQKKRLESVIGENLIMPDTCDNFQSTIISHYFVIGDNRCFSTDSRVFGTVPEDLIVGKADLILFSISSEGKLRNDRFIKKLSLQINSEEK
jgi:hypothetical protein